MARWSILTSTFKKRFMHNSEKSPTLALGWYIVNSVAFFLTTEDNLWKLSATYLMVENVKYPKQSHSLKFPFHPKHWLISYRLFPQIPSVVEVWGMGQLRRLLFGWIWISPAERGIVCCFFCRIRVDDIKSYTPTARVVLSNSLARTRIACIDFYRGSELPEWGRSHSTNIPKLSPDLDFPGRTHHPWDQTNKAQQPLPEVNITHN